MPERFWLSIKRTMIFYHCKEFFVKLKSVSKIFEKLFFQIRNINSAFNCFRRHFGIEKMIIKFERHVWLTIVYKNNNFFWFKVRFYWSKSWKAKISSNLKNISFFSFSKKKKEITNSKKNRCLNSVWRKLRWMNDFLCWYSIESNI